MATMRGNHCGLDGLDELWQVARQLDPLFHHFDRRGNRAAIGVSKDHDERRPQELDGIFEACEAVIVEKIPGETHNEKLARTLIEQKFGRDAAVGATEDRGDRILSLGARGPSDGKVPLSELVGNIASISLHQQVERFSRRDRIRVWRLGDWFAAGRREREGARCKERGSARYDGAP